MELQKVTYKQALLLEDFGFKGNSDSGYDLEGNYGIRTGEDGDVIWFYSRKGKSNHQFDSNHEIRLTPAPEVALAIKWLLEKKKIYISVLPVGKNEWRFDVVHLEKWRKNMAGSISWENVMERFKSRDKAEIAGLDWALTDLANEKLKKKKPSKT